MIFLNKIHFRILEANGCLLNFAVNQLAVSNRITKILYDNLAK